MNLSPSPLRTFPSRLLRPTILLGAALGGLGLGPTRAWAESDLGWPVPTQTNRPWTRWWWLGSAVDEQNLSRTLKLFHEAGIGGVEICPIYGAKGFESRFIPYLSKTWVDRVAFTINTAKDLGMGVDLTTGTGWPIGGPWVTPAMASETAIQQDFTVHAGDTKFPPIPRGALQAIVAVSETGESIDLSARVQEGQLRWTVPVGNWTVYSVYAKSPAQKVKRSAPGGEGSVLDPFSPAALTSYTDHIDEALQGSKAVPRAQFHDSYEYYGATWTPALFDQFRARRGYDLHPFLPALAGKGDPALVARVLCDYRQTMSDLHESYVQRWVDWNHHHGSLAREQAHGSPTNIEDTYALSDIPETEVFGPPSDAMAPMARFASSAAHLSGRPLASSETFTWLGEHFQVPLSSLKPEIDDLFLWGINHMLFHGMPYTPSDAAWPGWQFYAAVNFGPEGGLWHDLPGFLGYATRCQSLLQAGRPSSDVLLYFPIYDFWQKPDGLLKPLLTDGKWMDGTPFKLMSTELMMRGFAFEQVTDSLLAKATAEKGSVELGGGHFGTIVVPGVEVMPVATFRQLLALARGGATVAFIGQFPSTVPGLNNADKRTAELAALVQGLGAGTKADEVTTYDVGSGRVVLGDKITALLAAAGARRETMADLGLRFIRRERTDGTDYFVVNRSGKRIEGWVTLASPGDSAVILDPLRGTRAGSAPMRKAAGGGSELYLQLDAGESCFVRLALGPVKSPGVWAYDGTPGSPQVLSGKWQVQFIDGGPVLPDAFATDTLGSWTKRSDPKLQNFSGTARYTLTFDHPATAASDSILDLGKVASSARVRLNGSDLGIVWASPFRLRVGPYLKAGPNTIEVEVTNLAANRIADLDRRKVRWKSFYEINIVNLDYEPFDASGWPALDSGLLGPVTLTPFAAAHIAGP